MTSLSQDTQTVRYVTKGFDDFPLSRYSNCQVCHQRFWWLPSLKILKLSGMSPKVLMTSLSQDFPKGCDDSLSQDTQTVRYVTKGFDDFPLSRYSNCQVCHQRFWWLPSLKILKLSGMSPKVLMTSLSQDTQTVRYVTKGFDDFPLSRYSKVLMTSLSQDTQTVRYVTKGLEDFPPSRYSNYQVCHQRFWRLPSLKILKLSGMSPKVLMTSLSQDTQTVRYVTKGLDDFPLSRYSNCQVCHQRFWWLPSLKILKLSGMSPKVLMTSLSQDTQPVRYVTKGFDDFPLSRYSNCQVCHQRFWWLPSLKILKLSGMSPKVLTTVVTKELPSLKILKLSGMSPKVLTTSLSRYSNCQVCHQRFWRLPSLKILKLSGMSPKVLMTSLSQDTQTVRYVTKGFDDFPLSRYSNCQVCHQRFWWLPSLKILKLSGMSPKVWRTSLSQDDFPLSRYSNCQVCHQRFWWPSLKILKLSGMSPKVLMTSLSQDTQTVRYVTKGFDDFPLSDTQTVRYVTKGFDDFPLSRYSNCQVCHQRFRDTQTVTSLSQDTQTVRYVTKGFDDFPLKILKLSWYVTKGFDDFPLSRYSNCQVCHQRFGWLPSQDTQTVRYVTKGFDDFPLSRYSNCQVCHQRFRGQILKLFWWLPSLKILKLSGMSPKVLMTSLSQDTQTVRYVTKGLDDFPLSRYSNCQVCHQRFGWLPSLTKDTQTVRYVTKGLDDFPLSRYDTQTVRYVTKGFDDFPLSRYSNCQVCHQRFWWTSLSQDTQTVRYVTKGFDDFPLSRYSNCQVCHQRFWWLPSLKILKLSGMSPKVLMTSLSQDTQTVRYVTKGFDDFPLSRYSNCQVCHQRFWWLPSLKILKLSGMSPKVLTTSFSQDTQTVRYVTKGFDDFPLSRYSNCHKTFGDIPDSLSILREGSRQNLWWHTWQFEYLERGKSSKPLVTYLIVWVSREGSPLKLWWHTWQFEYLERGKSSRPLVTYLTVWVSWEREVLQTLWEDPAVGCYWGWAQRDVEVSRIPLAVCSAAWCVPSDDAGADIAPGRLAAPRCRTWHRQRWGTV